MVTERKPEKVDAISSVGYFLVGALAAWLDASPAAWSFALAMGVMGSVSAMHHLSPSSLTKRVDYAAIYFVQLTLLAIVLGAGPVLTTLYALGLATLYSWVSPTIGPIVVLTGALALAAWLASAWFAAAGLVVFAIALVCFVLNGRWAHTAWHTLSALAAGLIFLAGV